MACLWGAKGDLVARGGLEQWTRHETSALACPRRWAMLRDRLLYHAALLQPITMDLIIHLCIRPIAAQTTIVTTARPPLTTPGTTILLQVSFSYLNVQGEERFKNEIKDIEIY